MPERVTRRRQGGRYHNFQRCGAERSLPAGSLPCQGGGGLHSASGKPPTSPSPPAMYSLLSACTCLCLHFLLLCFQVQHGEMKAGRRAEKGSSLNASQGEAQGGKVLFKLKDAVGTRINRRKLDMFVAEENVDFRIHVENQTRARDDVSRKQLRLYQLYSRTSGKHIQVLGRRISAKGEDGDKYAQLLVETDTFGSQVRIKGKETDFYLCMNRKGKLVGKPDGTSKECVFIEKVLENNYTALMSAKYSGWYVGFTKKGRPRKGPKTRENQQDVHFMKRYPKGQVEIQKPFKYTTVTKRTKRIRPTNPS
ncbi:fibroblast growth factor 18 isoform X1 [Anas acuta]|uniref:Fibroblast growth factor n=2 Tax=Anatinae TaxID=2068716 RepID=A0A8B9T6A4_ANAPL|eukprot:XP_027324380.1 fibroblast growth factor 18 isoform X1 [Anas platyrhynchos]